MTTATTIVLLAEKACVLVTLAFLLTRTRLFPNRLQNRLSIRDQALATLLFLGLGFAEVGVTQGTHGPLNLRIVSVCVAGLLAGPWVGLVIGIAVTAMASFYGLPTAPIGLSMILAGVGGGAIRHWQPTIAGRLPTGFFLGAGISLLRDLLAVALGGSSITSPADWAFAALMHGASVALVLLVIQQIHSQEEQERAMAMYEVRALRARMDPHFLYNALNTLSALSAFEPDSVPAAAARLGQFLRASLDQHERPFVSLHEELQVVEAYLEIEKLRLGERLDVELDVDPRLMQAQVPPFILQPLVENAVRYGVEPVRDDASIRISATVVSDRISLCVSNTGAGIKPHRAKSLISCEPGTIHALELVRRRLEALYGREYRFEIESPSDGPTTATIELPLCRINLSRVPDSGISPAKVGVR